MERRKELPFVIQLLEELSWESRPSVKLFGLIRPTWMSWDYEGWRVGAKGRQEALSSLKLWLPFRVEVLFSFFSPLSWNMPPKCSNQIKTCWYKLTLHSFEKMFFKIKKCKPPQINRMWDFFKPLNHLITFIKLLFNNF